MMPTVLVIDDDPQIGLLLNRILSKHGYEILISTDGPSGIEQAMAQRPALIILDIIMPGMDGIEVAERLRSEPGTAAIPILFLTAYASARGRATAEAAEVDGIITKPFSVDDMVKTVKALTGSAG